jgi:transposase
MRATPAPHAPNRTVRSKTNFLSEAGQARRNKTDANDADGLAHLAEVGFYREVRVKGFDSMLIHTLVTARRQLLKMRLQMSNQIRGLMKTFGLVVPKGVGSVFERIEPHPPAAR